MGTLDNMGNSGGKGKPKGGSQKIAAFNRSRFINDFPYRSMGVPLFAAAIAALANDGAALMVGAAQGGRGIVLSIYQDGDKHRTYCNDGEEFTDWCHSVIETFAAQPDEVYAGYGLKRRGEK